MRVLTGHDTGRDSGDGFYENIGIVAKLSIVDGIPEITDNYLSNSVYIPQVITYNNNQYGNSLALVRGAAWDIEFDSQGNPTVAHITDCDNCLYSQDQASTGIGKVTKLNKITMEPISTADLNTVHAYDMRIGITSTTDGGFAVISTKGCETNDLPVTGGFTCNTFNIVTGKQIGRAHV